ncbi:MAG: ABC transporter permease [Victivallaceae bacterium]|nr:ABC transporter permease [Victivallaceae bacterium]
MMLARDLIGMSLHNLLLHKIRSVLTSLGVIFGVGSVIAMLAVSEGAKRKALAQLDALGIDKVIVYSKKPPPEGKNNSNQGVVDSYGLHSRDIANIKRMDNIAGVSVLRDSRCSILRGLVKLDAKLVAVTPDFLTESSSSIIRGRWLAPADFFNSSMVCVIGKNAKRKLFSIGTTNVVGKTVKIDKYRFRIVGELENDLGANYPELGDPNDMIVVPDTTLYKLMQNYSFIMNRRTMAITMVDCDLALIKVKDISYIDDTSKRITAYLNKVHDQQDWGVLVPLDLLKQKESTQNIFTIVMSSIAGISLIVGGIGIMNIMLASVFERRKEIGTRRALGAQKPDILFQFLIETVFLTSIGGILGILTGIGISQLITIYADMPTVYSSWSIVLSLAISSFVGVVFGTYPAWKAAQQNPIEVLRAE